MPMSLQDSNKAVLQELEFLRADLELLRLEVDSISLDTKLLNQLLAITAMTPKDMSDYK